MPSAKSLLIWTGLACVMVGPLVVSAMSPLLAWRDAIYIAASFAGVFAMTILVLQPLLGGAVLPGLSRQRSRKVHQLSGILLLAALVLHVGGLWITSPPDVIDALTFMSPTPFSAWGVVAMWALLVIGAMTFLRRRLHLPPARWRIFHKCLGGVVVLGTIVHAILVEATLPQIAKWSLGALVLVATAYAFWSVKLHRKPS